MARLPGIELRPRAGDDPSMAHLQATDLGLGDAAQAVAEVGQALKARDDKAVQPYLDELAAGYGRDFATNAEAADPTQPGLAKSLTDRFDMHAGEVMTRANLSGGQAEALRRGIEKQRLAWGQKAIGAEIQKSGELAADQERARRNGVATGKVGDYLAAIAPRDKALDDAYDGTSPTYVADKLALHDEVATQVLEATPEQDRADVKVKLDNQRLEIRNTATALTEKLHDAVIARQTGRTTETLANGVVSNPNAIGAALAALPDAYADVPAALRPKALEQGYEKLATARVLGLVATGRPALAVAELKGGRWDAYLEPEAKAQLLRSGQNEAGQRARQALEAGHYGGEIPSGADADAQASGDVGLQQELRYRREVGWAEGDALGDGFGGGKAGFEAAANFTIDQLEGGEGNIKNDNGRGLSRFGINQAANPDLNVSTLSRAGAVTRYRKYWNAVGADRLAPDTALAAFDAAVLFGPEKANRWTAESGGDVPKFLALEQAEMRRLAAADPKKYGDDLKGWLNRAEKVRGEAARTAGFVNMRDGVAGDPIKFAAKAPALRSQVAVLGPDPTAAGWGAALQARLTLGRRLNQAYQAPLRMLSDADAAFYKDKIAQDPTFALTLAKASLASVGETATRSLLGEVGQQGEASVHLHLADLHTMGLSEFAARAEKGLALAKAGATLDKTDAADLEAAIEARKTLFAGMPELRQSVLASSRAAMLADSQTAEAKDPAAYLSAALGGAVRGGKTFGGLAYLNQTLTVLPHWLAVDYADDAMETMGQAWAATGRGPHFASGKPVPAKQLRNASVQLLPNGHYRLSGYTTADGRPFEFDWEQARVALRAKLGAQAVLPPQEMR